MNFKKILLPLDGSSLAEQVLAPAIGIAATMSTEIVLLHVVVPLDIDLVLPEASLPHAEEEAERYLAAVSARFYADGVNMTTAVVVGTEAAVVLINYAYENDVDLIMISSHGRSGLTRWRYGGVTARLLRQATCPVLVIPNQTDIEPFALRRILLPLDGSDLAEEALEPAVALAEAMSAELILLRAVPLLLISLESMTAEGDIEHIAEARVEALAYLEQTKASLTMTYKIPVKMEVIIGSAADVIVDYADEHDIDLIAMSSHGRSGISLWTYGSITEKVLLGTDRATMVVRRKSPAYLQEHWT